MCVHINVTRIIIIISVDGVHEKLTLMVTFSAQAAKKCGSGGVGLWYCARKEQNGHMLRLKQSGRPSWSRHFLSKCHLAVAFLHILFFSTQMNTSLTHERFKKMAWASGFLKHIVIDLLFITFSCLAHSLQAFVRIRFLKLPCAFAAGGCSLSVYMHCIAQVLHARCYLLVQV